MASCSAASEPAEIVLAGLIETNTAGALRPLSGVRVTPARGYKEFGQRISHRACNTLAGFIVAMSEEIASA